MQSQSRAWLLKPLTLAEDGAGPAWPEAHPGPRGLVGWLQGEAGAGVGHARALVGSHWILARGRETVAFLVMLYPVYR